MRISRTRGLEDKEEVSRPSNPPLNNELQSNEVENEAILPSTITDEMSIAIQMQLWADATKERRMLNLTQDNTSAEKGATGPVESLTTEPASVNLSTAAPNANTPPRKIVSAIRQGAPTLTRQQDSSFPTEQDIDINSEDSPYRTRSEGESSTKNFNSSTRNSPVFRKAQMRRKNTRLFTTPAGLESAPMNTDEFLTTNTAPGQPSFSKLAINGTDASKSVSPSTRVLGSASTLSATPNAEVSSLTFDGDHLNRLTPPYQYDTVLEAGQDKANRRNTNRLLPKRFASIVVSIVIIIVCGAVGISLLLWKGDADPMVVLSTSKPSVSQIPSPVPSIFPSPIPSKAPAVHPSNSPTDVSSYIDAIIYSNAKFHGEEFKDDDTYQSQALRWMREKGQLIVENNTSLGAVDSVLQLYSLACIYYSTYEISNEITDITDDLKPWITSDGWLEDVSLLGCNWHGVSCNSQGKVKRLNLAKNGLTGSIPPELTFLNGSLQYLDLYQNSVHNKGIEGNEFLGELTKLEKLFLGNTYFEYDGIPTELGLLTNLVELDLSYTYYFGAVTFFPWSQLQSLEYLALEGMAFHSPLPVELYSLPNLEQLYVSDSFVTGDLEFISKMPKIKELWISGNDLSPSIPSSLGQATTLVSFSASHCNLQGRLPSELGLLTGSLKSLWLNNNLLYGQIPGEYANLAQLVTLNLLGNLLTGHMPKAICENRSPLGRLDELEVDLEIACDADCCTCCGHAGSDS